MKIKLSSLFIGLVILASVQRITAQDTNPGNAPAVAPISNPAGMVLIPAGSFTIGDTLDGERDARPTNVYVSAFYMDTNLVSIGQWFTVLRWAYTNGYSCGNFDAHEHSGNYPVVFVDWYGAVAWCNARSQQAGLNPVYFTDAGLTQVYTNESLIYANGSSTAFLAIYANWTNNGYRLPTEAEWEKAARGGLSGQRFPWGNTISESQANYYAKPNPTNSDGFTYDLGPYTGVNTNFDLNASPVGYFPPNGYGLYDMAGNVFQWCWDASNYKRDPGSPYLGGEDPQVPALNSNNSHVIRGGSFCNLPNAAKCSQRAESYDEQYDIGFRCVRRL